ncbi:hypothetical protein ACFL6U_07895 [Planctomycetota bacterium]
MNHPKLNLSMAVAIVTVNILLFGVLPGGPVALADVWEQLEAIHTYQFTQSMDMDPNEMQVFPPEMTVLVSDQYGMKMEGKGMSPLTGQPTTQQIYLLTDQKICLQIYPEEKLYLRMEMEGNSAQDVNQGMSDPRKIIELMQTFTPTHLEPTTMEGKRVFGYQTTDPSITGMQSGEVTVQLWVDASTLLPVCLDIQFENGRHRNHSFKWNVDLDPNAFVFEIPEDYTPLSTTKMMVPSADEENAIKGLQLFADFTGRYLTDLSLETFKKDIQVFGQAMMSKKTQASRDFMQEIKQLKNPLEAGMRGAQLTTPLTSLGFFNMRLIQAQQEPAYYGDIVTPQDTNKVLMRWRLDDGNYRVIFGDLRLETVTKDTLDELERDLSN